MAPAPATTIGRFVIILACPLNDLPSIAEAVPAAHSRSCGAIAL
jgi:hypothetical protein